jgi:RTX calcium-binding nonapeptide repeat (4 copies)/Penicillin amidase
VRPALAIATTGASDRYPAGSVHASARILTYSLSENPDSPYYADQTRMFSGKQWVKVPYCESEIAADPGLQVTPLNCGYTSGEPEPGGPGGPPGKSAGSCTVEGTAGKDRLTGTPGDDVICAGGGGDEVRGKGGDDVLLGGGAPDRLAGGAGADRLHGERGRDALLGGPDADDLVGGPGRDSRKQ